MSSSDQYPVYEFGGFKLDIARRRLLSADGLPVDLSSRVFDTLLCLVENHGRLVDKSTLLETVWPDTVVEENNLNQAIATLRKALGDTRREHRFIATDPGRGYRFVAEVIPREDLEPAREPTESISWLPGKELRVAIVAILSIAAIFLVAQQLLWTKGSSIFEPQSTEQTIAVRPFADMSPGRDQEYFSDGIAEELLNELSKLRGLRVAGRTSSFSFKNRNEDLRVIGEKLNVDNVLEGSVRKAGNRVRITVNLVNTSDGYNLWSQTFDSDPEDIFAIQDETAKSVANALSLTLGVGEAELGIGGTRNFYAYDAYLAGASLRRNGDPESMLQAMELLEKAVALDPEYARAWNTLAGVYESSASFFVADRTKELLRKSEMAASRAVEIAPHAVSSLMAAAQLHKQNRDWEQAELMLQEAHAKAPTDFWTNMRLGFFNLDICQPSGAIPYFRQASKSEPLLLLPVQNTILALGYLGEIDAALDEYERSKLLIGNHALTLAVVATVAMEAGDRARFENYLDELITNDPGPNDNRPFTRTMRTLLDSPEAARAELRKFDNDANYQFPLSRNATAIWASYFDD